MVQRMSYNMLTTVERLCMHAQRLRYNIPTATWPRLTCSRRSARISVTGYYSRSARARTHHELCYAVEAHLICPGDLDLRNLIKFYCTPENSMNDPMEA